MSANSRSIKRWFKRFVVLVVILGVASIVGVLVINARPADVESAAVVAANEARIRRSMEAYAARNTGMAEHYATLKGALQRSAVAYGARYTGMAEHYTGERHSRQRAMAAYAARCTGIAEHYAATGR